VRRSLRNILKLDDFEPAARSHLPRPLFSYVSGGVEDFVTLRDNRAAFADWGFVPRVLVGVGNRTQSVDLLGKTYAHPFGIGPMGISAMTAYRGDLVLARCAKEANVPMVVSGSALIRLPHADADGRHPRHAQSRAQPARRLHEPAQA
jgi:L-lactate dehydrogenase (cytochrome)